MTTKFQKLSLLIFLGLLTTYSYAIEDEKKEQTLQEEITEYINHHVQDSHDFSLFSTKDKETGEKIYIDFPLPVILVDEGVQVFMSSKLEHGKKVVNKGGKYYRLYHGKIYETNSEGLIEYDAKGKVINQVEEFNKIIPITGIIMTKLDGTAKGGILLALAKKYKLPIIALGLGEKEDDLQLFDAEKFAEAFTQIN